MPLTTVVMATMMVVTVATSNELTFSIYALGILLGLDMRYRLPMC
jgi:hypothetical protein